MSSIVDINPNTLLIKNEETAVNVTLSVSSHKDNNNSGISLADIKGYIVFDNNGVLLTSQEVSTERKMISPAWEMDWLCIYSSYQPCKQLWFHH